MEGVTNPAVRELMVGRGGIGVMCTEFVRVTSHPLGRKVLLKHVVRPSKGILSVQVMGNDLTQMAEATAMVTDAGAHVVDINLGCPAPKAVRKGVGSAMLKDLALLGRVVSAMRARTDLPLSAKIRAGFDDASRVLDVARVVQESGADFLTVHPRRRIDFYRGVADWRIIRVLSQSLSIPVVGNGDIWYAADALRMRQETGCAAVMLGRPALRNPWIFRQIDELSRGREPFLPTAAAVLEHLTELIGSLAAFLPQRNILGMAKEHLRYLMRAVPDDGSVLRDVLRHDELSSLPAKVGEVLHAVEGPLDLAAEGGTRETSGSALGEAASLAPGAQNAGSSLVPPASALV